MLTRTSMIMLEEWILSHDHAREVDYVSASAEKSRSDHFDI